MQYINKNFRLTYIIILLGVPFIPSLIIIQYQECTIQYGYQHTNLKRKYFSFIFRQYQHTLIVLYNVILLNLTVEQYQDD